MSSPTLQNFSTNSSMLSHLQGNRKDIKNKQLKIIILINQLQRKKEPPLQTKNKKQKQNLIRLITAYNICFFLYMNHLYV